MLNMCCVRKTFTSLSWYLQRPPRLFTFSVSDVLFSITPAFLDMCPVEEILPVAPFRTCSLLMPAESSREKVLLQKHTVLGAWLKESKSACDLDCVLPFKFCTSGSQTLFVQFLIFTWNEFTKPVDKDNEQYHWQMLFRSAKGLTRSQWSRKVTFTKYGHKHFLQIHNFAKIRNLTIRSSIIEVSYTTSWIGTVVLEQKTSWTPR
jgi:hypothetical protein